MIANLSPHEPSLEIVIFIYDGNEDSNEPLELEEK